MNPRIARCLAASATLMSLAVVGRAHAFPQTPSKPGGAMPTDMVPQPLVGIGIEEHPGAYVPKGLKFRDQDGKTVSLDDYFTRDGKGDGKPVVIDFAYYDCPMLCSIVLNGLKDGLKQLAWQPGKEFHVVIASIDPRDDAEKAQKKRKAYLDAYGKPVGERGWDFLVGPKPEGKVDSPFDPVEIRSDDLAARELAKVAGFSYRWDDKTSQYAHAAGVFVFTPDGRLSRVLYGIQFSERDLRLALTEASAGKLGTAWDRVLLLCYHYDPNEHSYVLAGKRMMSAGGALTALLLGTFLVRLWRKEMQRPPETPS